ncbi:unnamed protein product [Caenorhabditis brenneri]
MAELEMRYPSLRILLEHLEANKRIELVSRCPALKHVDKAVPISFDTLFLSKTCTQINTTLYKVGVVRQYPKDGPKILKEYQRNNDYGGASDDLNQFGKLDRSGEQVVNPSDLTVARAYDPIIERDLEEEDLYMEELKARLAHLNRLKKMKKREEEKERIEAKLFEWNLRKENKQPPYAMYLKYIKKKGSKTECFEYLEYNHKLHEAVQYMYNYLYGGRKRTFRVKRLSISGVGGVIRFPKALTIRARELATGYNFASVYKSIKHILVNETFEEIVVQEGWGISTHYDYDHPAMTSAKTLLIWDTKVTGNAFQIILNDKHPRLDVSKGKCTKEEYLELIDKMVADKRTPGTYYSFGVQSKDLLKKLFNDLKQKDGFRTGKLLVNEPRRFPDHYYKYITEKSYISIACNHRPDYNDKTRKVESWTLWICVYATVENPKKKVKEPEKQKKDFLRIIDDMISSKKEIGSCESMEVYSKKVVKEVFKEVMLSDKATFRKEEKRGCARFPFTYSLPIDNLTKVVIFCNRNHDLNKKGVKQKPWTMWFFVEKIDEMTVEDYKKFLDKIISEKKKIGTSYSVDLRTKGQVKELQSEVEKRDGVTFRELINRGCFQIPKTYTCPLNDSSKLTIFCVRKEDYNRKDPADRRWVLRHCVERVDKKKVVKT